MIADVVAVVRVAHVGSEGGYCSAHGPAAIPKSYYRSATEWRKGARSAVGCGTQNGCSFEIVSGS